MRIWKSKFTTVMLTIFVVFSVVGFAYPLFATSYYGVGNFTGQLTGSKFILSDFTQPGAITDSNYNEGGHIEVPTRGALFGYPTFPGSYMSATNTLLTSGTSSELIYLTPQRRRLGELVTVLFDSPTYSATTTYADAQAIAGSSPSQHIVTYRLIRNPLNGANCEISGTTYGYVTDQSLDGLATACPHTSMSDWQVVIPEITAANEMKFLTTTDGINLSWQTPAGGGGGSSTNIIVSPSTVGSYNATTTIFTINQSGTSTDGYLSSIDWNNFNNKLTSTLADGYIFVGSASGTATSVSLHGDGIINDAGLFTLATVGVATTTSYTSADITVDANGRIIAATSTTPTSGTVTSVSTGAGLLGGPITTAGTISLDFNSSNNWLTSQYFSDGTATSSFGTISIGNGGFGGGGTVPDFFGSASGTELAINATSTFSGNFADFQIGGISKTSIDATGAITSAALAGGTLGVNNCVVADPSTGKLGLGTCGGSLSVGTPVTSGVPNEALYIDNSGNLSQSVNFAFNNSTANPGFSVGDNAGLGNNTVFNLNDALGQVNISSNSRGSTSLSSAVVYYPSGGGGTNDFNETGGFSSSAGTYTYDVAIDQINAQIVSYSGATASFMVGNEIYDNTTNTDLGILLYDDGAGTLVISGTAPTVNPGDTLGDNDPIAGTGSPTMTLSADAISLGDTFDWSDSGTGGSLTNVPIIGFGTSQTLDNSETINFSDGPEGVGRNPGDYWEWTYTVTATTSQNMLALDGQNRTYFIGDNLNNKTQLAIDDINNTIFLGDAPTPLHSGFQYYGPNFVGSPVYVDGVTINQPSRLYTFGNVHNNSTDLEVNDATGSQSIITNGLVTQFNNANTGDPYFSADTRNNLYQLGDLLGDNNGTQLTINDTLGFQSIFLTSNSVAATTSNGLVSIGDGRFDRLSSGSFVGSATGTELAINSSSGFTGNLLDLQVAGTSTLSVDATGAIKSLSLVGGGFGTNCLAADPITGKIELTSCGGLGSMTIGQGVSSSTKNEILFMDGSNSLAQSGNLYFKNGPTPIFSVGDVTGNGNQTYFNITDSTNSVSISGNRSASSTPAHYATATFSGGFGDHDKFDYSYPAAGTIYSGVRIVTYTITVNGNTDWGTNFSPTWGAGRHYFVVGDVLKDSVTGATGTIMSGSGSGPYTIYVSHSPGVNGSDFFLHNYTVVSGPDSGSAGITNKVGLVTDTFTWTGSDGSSSAHPLPLTTSPYTLANGAQVRWLDVIGYTVGDQWSFVAYPTGYTYGNMLTLDGQHHQFTLGDINGVNNGTQLGIDDGAQTFDVMNANVGGSVIHADLSGYNVALGDWNGVSNQTTLTVDNSSQSVLITGNTTATSATLTTPVTPSITGTEDFGGESGFSSGTPGTYNYTVTIDEVNTQAIVYSSETGILSGTVSNGTGVSGTVVSDDGAGNLVVTNVTGGSFAMSDNLSDGTNSTTIDTSVTSLYDTFDWSDSLGGSATNVAIIGSGTPQTLDNSETINFGSAGGIGRVSGDSWTWAYTTTGASLGGTMLSLDGANHQFAIGDLDGYGNGTFLGVDDANQTIRLRSYPTPSSPNYGLVSIGEGIFSNLSSIGKFMGSASGTELAINAKGGIAPFTGNLIDAQVGGASMFSVDASGNIIDAGLAGYGPGCVATDNFGALSVTTCGSGGVAGTVGVSHGGTGLTALPYGTLIFGSGTDTLSTLSISSTSTAPTSSGTTFLTSDGTSPQWSVAGSMLGSGIFGYVPLDTSGGSITGDLTVGGRLYVAHDPLTGTEVATKNYVDSMASGLNWKAAVNASTDSALPSYTYSNGTAGVGATITMTSVGAVTFDGYTPVATGERILVKDETGGNTPNNGIYIVSVLGDISTAEVLTRATDADTPTALNHATVNVTNGTTNAGKAFTQTNTIATVGSDNVTWVVAFNSTYTAGAGLTLTGNSFSANVDGLSLDVAATGTALEIKNGGVSTNKIADQAVTLAKIQNIAGNSLLGNVSTSTGIATVISIGNGLSFLGTTLNATVADATSTNSSLAITSNTMTGVYDVQINTSHSNDWTATTTFDGNTVFNGGLSLPSATGTHIFFASSPLNGSILYTDGNGYLQQLAFGGSGLAGQILALNASGTSIVWEDLPSEHVLFNGNRPIGLDGVPSLDGVNLDTANLKDFLNGVFFRTVNPKGTLAISGGGLNVREYGGSTSVSLDYSVTERTNPVTGIDITADSGGTGCSGLSTSGLTMDGDTISGTCGSAATLTSTPASLGTPTIFSLAVTASGTTVVATTTMFYYPTVYFGATSTDLMTMSTGSTLWNAIQSLGGNVQSSRTVPVTAFTGDNEYVYFAWPTDSSPFTTYDPSGNCVNISGGSTTHCFNSGSTATTIFDTTDMLHRTLSGFVNGSGFSISYELYRAHFRITPGSTVYYQVH